MGAGKNDERSPPLLECERSSFLRMRLVVERDFGDRFGLHATELHPALLDAGVFSAENCSREEGRVLRARLADRQGADGDSRRHLDDGQQGVEAFE